MEEKSLSEQEEKKPFSVLEKFRQLKKDKEIPDESKPGISPTTTQTGQTEFAASPSSHNASNGDFSTGGRGGFNRKRHFENSSDRPSRRAGEMHIGQQEKDVGITEYIRPGPGFEVIFKHRYSDFYVNEIDIDGNVVKLTSLEIPENPEEEETETKEDLTILTQEQWDSIREVVTKELDSTIDIDVTDFNKDKRQKIHKAVKRTFGVHTFTNTVDSDNNRKLLKIGYASRKKDHRFTAWPRGRPEYLHFVLFKENAEMNEAITSLCQRTHIKARKFGFAGTKDKRSISSQQVCVRKGDVEKFRSCRNLRNVAVGNFNYKWSNLRLGDLSGNRFVITLRNVKASDEIIDEAVCCLREKGFINYFGLQRFGQSVIVPTHFVGKAILKGDWQLAAELILKPRPGESCFYDVKQAREIWWQTRDPIEALQPLTRKDRTIEGKLLIGLKKSGNKAYQCAFDHLPRNTVSMYLHAYQSLIWNKVVSRRVKEFGLKVLPGDLVEVEAGTEEEQLLENNEESEDDEMEPAAEFDRRMYVRTLSAEEAKTASIYKVLYPLIGGDIKLPDNEVAKWFLDLLAEEGFTLGSFKKVKVKYGMYGSYRFMMERPTDFSWRSMRYSDPDETLLLSDLDRLKGKPAPVTDPDGPYKAVILEFNLKTCCYATMAMRELAKCETSTSSQALLTNQVREDNLAAKRRKEEDVSQEQEEGKKEEEKELVDSENSVLNNELVTNEIPQISRSMAGETIEEELRNNAELDNMLNKNMDTNLCSTHM